jgi:rod shape determining protein RodA
VIAAQLFINAGMNMGLLPITGITLPFISFGGSSLISLLILIALAQSVHLHRRERILI